MRLWHYKLIPVLPDAMLISQWKECIAIKRQWEKGTLKHRLVSYVMDYDKLYFQNYVDMVVDELNKRNIKWRSKFHIEICDFTGVYTTDRDNWDDLLYPEHSKRYLEQCYFNLQEKFDRGIITKEEYKKIEDLWLEVLKDRYL